MDSNKIDVAKAADGLIARTERQLRTDEAVLGIKRDGNHQDKELSGDLIADVAREAFAHALKGGNIWALEKLPKRVELDAAIAASPQLPVAEQPAGQAVSDDLRKLLEDARAAADAYGIRDDCTTNEGMENAESVVKRIDALLANDAPHSPVVQIQDDTSKKLARAERALMRAGFVDKGGEEWKPPIGKPPVFIEVPVAQMSGDLLECVRIASECLKGTQRSPDQQLALNILTLAYSGKYVEALECVDASHPSNAATQDARDIPTDTGNPEADRIIRRLASSDPDFDDCTAAAAFIYKLVAEHRGPEGFATWKDAAFAERMKRVELEQAATVPQVVQSVPVDVTPAMAKAAADAWLDCGSKLILNKAAAAVRAGIDAAPQPVAASPSIVPSDEQRAEIQRLAQMADAAIQQSPSDMRNIMEDIANGLTALLTTASNAGEAAQGDKGVVSGADRTTSGSVGQP